MQALGFVKCSAKDRQKCRSSTQNERLFGDTKCQQLSADNKTSIDSRQSIKQQEAKEGTSK